MASGDYLRPGQLIEVDTTGEDPEFTRHPNVLGHRKIVSPPETPINLDPIVSLKDPGSLDAASASQLEFEELNTKNPDVLIDAGSVTDGSEYRDNSPPDSDSDSDSEFEPEPEMTELDSTEEREEKDARIHAMAAKIHHRLAEEKERVGLNTEEEEMLRSLEESKWDCGLEATEDKLTHRQVRTTSARVTAVMSPRSLRARVMRPGHRNLPKWILPTCTLLPHQFPSKTSPIANTLILVVSPFNLQLFSTVS
jgi:hypothetical protein